MPTEHKSARRKRYAELAKKFNCDPKTIERADAAGAPLHDIEALSNWFAERRTGPTGEGVGTGNLSSLADMKIEKLRCECERLKIKIDAEKKRLIPADHVRRDMVRIGNAFRSELMRFAGDVPNWEGLPASQLQARVDEKLESLCTELSNAFSELYQ
jgi:hypothetical protein